LAENIKEKKITYFLILLLVGYPLAEMPACAPSITWNPSSGRMIIEKGGKENES
jgi:hypothetical protein